jgi:uncharacterized protein YabN with tetrapyrrole methylase and pyrophosphatase domain
MSTLGSLVVVGTGIKAVSHLTLEAVDQITRADRVLFVVADPLTEHWLQERNPRSESLHPCYVDGEHRMKAYTRMVEAIVASVQGGARTCAVFNGHPGVFAYATHESIRQVRALGGDARMLPAVSAEDCLFADLGIDPGVAGCQSFEATDFLINQRRFDPRSTLVIWQVGIVGQLEYSASGFSGRAVGVLVERLVEDYGADHEVVLYEASRYALCDPVINRCRLGDLARQAMSSATTLCVPPKARACSSREAVEKLAAHLAEDSPLREIAARARAAK